ncbi:MAG: dephospho-CoA kinase [Clostridia bacterium]|nr:dephospho-CoA kinase [Clostridia bacterium]
MVIIGLTGGIATGKSTVAAMLEELGAVVVDADQVAREVVEPGEILDRIAAAFGRDVLTPDGRLDRAALGRKVFGDDEALKRLNAITHPEIRRRITRRVEELRREGRAPAVVLDIPLLFEGGVAYAVDEIWVVAVDRETQLRRLMERNGLSRPEAEARVASQMPIEEKVRRADVVIDNSGDLAVTRAQVEAAWRRLTGRGQR